VIDGSQPPQENSTQFTYTLILWLLCAQPSNAFESLTAPSLPLLIGIRFAQVADSTASALFANGE